uniref:Uncharacterized protein n=1 Tax=Aegilops tauschii subsp. strangulata TaxID=200361 RepID=A0A453TEX5_AEGTS
VPTPAAVTFPVCRSSFFLPWLAVCMVAKGTTSTYRMRAWQPLLLPATTFFRQQQQTKTTTPTLLLLPASSEQTQ